MAESVALPEERAALEAHLARCGPCRGIVAAVAGLHIDGRSAAPPSRGRRLRVAVVAALLVVATTLVLLWWLRELERRVVVDPDRALVAAAAELVRQEPGLFADFAPFLHRERLAPSPTLQRGGVALLAPIGKVGDERPLLRWERVAGVDEWQVSVLQADGTPLWTGSTAETQHAWPESQPAPLAGSTCLCEVVGQGAAGRAVARGSFVLAERSEVEALRAARAAIERLAPQDRAVLFAQFSLRRGFLAEAEVALRARLSEKPDDTLAVETLLHVLEQLGAREATTLRARFDRRSRQGG
jgi:hypothetical protein